MLGHNKGPRRRGTRRPEHKNRRALESSRNDGPIQSRTAIRSVGSLPYCSPPPSLQVSGVVSNRGAGICDGVGYGFGVQSGSLATPAVPAYTTPGQQTWFAYNAGTFANGRRESWTPQLYYSVGPVGLLGEWTNTAQVFTRGANTQTVSNTAWQVQLAWVLTGEDASYLGVTPSQNFSLKGGHWGSLTLVSRVSQLKIDSDAFVGTPATQLANPNTQPGKATDYGIGLSWGLSREVSIYFTYDQTKFDGGAPNGNNRPDEKVLITRFQYAL